MQRTGLDYWRMEKLGKEPLLKDPILIEGLPGIGNVGKVAVDFLIDELDAVPLYRYHSYRMPHSVFVNDRNLVELPGLMMYYIKRPRKKNDLLLLGGDIQPIDELSSYLFCEMMLRSLKGFGGSELITLGGIGLQEIPENPQVFCTANKPAIIKRYRTGVKLNTKIYGVVGPIIGISGLLVGMASEYKLQGIALLAETYGHPMYMGIKGAREILKILSSKLDIKLNINELDSEVKKIEDEILKRKEELMNFQEQQAMKKIKTQVLEEAKYIG